MTQQEKFTEGLVILTKLGGTDVSADHEIVFAGGPLPSETDEVVGKKLSDLGWNWDDTYECWRFHT